MAGVLILGGGTAGTWTANRLRRAGARVTVVDAFGDHIYQPGLLSLAFNGRSPESLRRDERSLLDAGIDLRVARVGAVNMERRRVELEGGESLEADAIVIATGSRLHRGDIPGLGEHGHDFYCHRRVEALQARLREWRGGRVVIGPARLPHKCPPVPHQFALRFAAAFPGSEIVFVYPLPRIYPHPDVAAFFEAQFRRRGITWMAPFVTSHVEPGRVVAASGMELAFDLLVMVPPHRGALGEWVRVDRETLRAGERVYALGDAADLPVPKSAAAAHFQGAVVVENVLAELAGREPPARYDGRVT